MATVAGSSSTTAVVNTVSGGTNIPWTQTAGGTRIRWISGRVPAGGFTLTTTDISIWAHESGTSANAGGSFTLYSRAPSGVETEIVGGPFDDGVEFTKDTPTEMTWAGNVTDTPLAENDRLVLEVRIDGVGAGMGASQNCTLTYNGADAATGDSFLNLNETVTFKAEAAFLDTDNNWAGDAYLPQTVVGIKSASLTSEILTSAIAQVVAIGDPSEILPIPIVLEDGYWQNPVFAVSPSVYQTLPYLPDIEETLGWTSWESGDYWQIVQYQLPFRRLPIGQDFDDFVQSAAIAEEDYWQSPQISEYKTLTILPFTEDDFVALVAGTLGVDEDYWISPVFATGGSIYFRLPYLPDLDNFTGWIETDEVYWQNSVLPVVSSLYQRLPVLWDREEPPAALYGQPTEEYWISWVRPRPPTIYQVLPYLPDGEDRSKGPVESAKIFEISAHPLVTMRISVKDRVLLDIVA